MKLFCFDTDAERDWIAAETQEQATKIYKNHYGLHDSDLDGCEVSECDPNEVTVYPDGWDCDDDEIEPPTAAEFMTKPGLVCSTCQ